MPVNTDCQVNVKSCLTILTGFSEIEPRPIKNLDFWGSKITKSIFFSNFFITKTSDFISKMNDDFISKMNDDFMKIEIYNIFQGQQYTILEFFSKIFFVILTSITSKTS